jgi:hypothetical protein
VQVVFGDYHVFSVWGLDRQPALLLGMDALGSFEGLVIDLKRGVLHLRAPAGAGLTRAQHTCHAAAQSMLPSCDRLSDRSLAPAHAAAEAAAT